MYLDAGSTESFQFLGAYPLFLELGALAVCSLENMTPLDKVAQSHFTLICLLPCCCICVYIVQCFLSGFSENCRFLNSHSH